MQSKVQSFPSEGRRLTPSETPNLRLCTGPKIGDGKSIEFQNVVVYSSQCFVHSGLVTIGGITQHANFGIGKIVIAQGDGVVDDAGEVGVHSGFSVSSKGDDVGAAAFLLHRLQFLLKDFGNLFASGDAQFGFGVTIETAFAINAIEGAKFSIGG